jgi:sulfatase maturation enzyme AslB (radical SAM superfamily)
MPLAKVRVILHGGEPLLAGVPWLGKVAWPLSDFRWPAVAHSISQQTKEQPR